MLRLNTKVKLDKTQPIFLGIDVHKKTCSLSFIHIDQLVGRFTISTQGDELNKLLKRYKDLKVFSVYEAGFSGFDLHYRLKHYGVENIIISPNKLPIVTGDKVKTDKRDSLKLASFLSKGLLRSIYIPSKEHLSLRQAMRTRNQLAMKKRRCLCQMKALLIQYGISIESRVMSRKVITEIKSLDLPLLIKSSVLVHLETFEFLSIQIKNMECVARESIVKKEDKANYKLLTSVPGIGAITATALLYEIQDWSRFKNSKQIAAYFGLTPSEYSSGDKVRHGRITGQGSTWLRALLIEASWFLIAKDPAMEKVFNRIFTNAKSKKKAIVAIARRLICRLYSMIKNQRPYQIGLLG